MINKNLQYTHNEYVDFFINDYPFYCLNHDFD